MFVIFKSSVVTIKVAIAIPDTGLLLLPTIPTIRADTVAKKKPNITINKAPRKFTSIPGNAHISNANSKVPPITIYIGRSLSVLSP